MTKKIALLILICSTNIFAYEFTFSKIFKQEVLSNILSANIIITMKSKSEDAINDNLEDINYFFTNNKTIQKSNGRYSLTPNYSYKNNTQKFVNFSGNLAYTIESKRAGDLNEFIKDLIELKKTLKEDKLKINIQNMHWKISKELKDTAYNTLRFSSINWIKSYASSLNMSCAIKQININPNKNYISNRSHDMRALKTAANIVPISTKHEISMNVNYVLECK